MRRLLSVDVSFPSDNLISGCAMISSYFFVFIRGVYSWIIPSILEETRILLWKVEVNGERKDLDKRFVSVFNI